MVGIESLGIFFFGEIVLVSVVVLLLYFELVVNLIGVGGVVVIGVVVGDLIGYLIGCCFGLLLFDWLGWRFLKYFGFGYVVFVEWLFN